jgi:nucleolin
MSKVKSTKKIEEILSSSEEEVPKKKVTNKKAKKVVDSDESSEESVELLKKKTDRKGSNTAKANAETAKKSKKVVESDDSSSEEVVKKAPVKPAPAKKAPVASDSDDSSSEEVVKKAPVKAAPAKAAPAKKAPVSSDDDSSSEEVVKKAPAKAAPAKAAPAKKAPVSSDEESSSEEVVTKKPAKAAPKKAESDDEEESIEFKPQAKVEHKAPESNCTELFCKNLPWSADENKLYEFFGTYGTVNNVKVLYDKMTGKARGLAFVEFSTRAEAQKALDDAANLFIDSRNLQVSFSDNKPQPSAGGFQKQGGYGGNQGGYGGNQGGYGGNQGGFQKKFHDGEKFTAFVGNLGFKTTEASVGAFFADCGNVVDVRIAKNPEDGRSKGYAHVDFDSNEAVQKAMKKAGQDLDGRDVRVDASTPRQGGGDRKLFFNFHLK